ncbi:hypothetical protein [Fimbriimonas ginsengisoli]|uniref:Uncharacterized protein n=1 Tax=Fimbriimonas ginsengisoli Gsoil 348 TaxID=661478 RepID=A0A068NVU2_FIMGI|nr:hypothetical protein [Fimbriimonas ginsengisoli]AIE85724.1 hypothetical protein OP10G_2356 [Fimbriimonas ginsengisoli Gsoil 348]
MVKAAIPANESLRLETLAQYHVLDTLNELDVNQFKNLNDTFGHSVG